MQTRFKSACGSCSFVIPSIPLCLVDHHDVKCIPALSKTLCCTCWALLLCRCRYNLDSNLPHPQPFPTSPEDPAGQQALRAYLQEQLQQQGQLFLVLEHTAGAGGRSEVAGEALPVDAMPPAAAAAKLTTQ